MKLKLLFIVILLSGIYACQFEGKEKTLFNQIDPHHSGIDFKNLIPDNDSFNILTYEYIYNGGGVAIADFDNDGLSDLFFSGNLVGNKLYKNKGDLQ